MSIEYLDKTHARLWVSVGSGKHRKRFSKRIEYNGKKDAIRQLKEFEAELSTKQDKRLTVEQLINSYIKEKELLGVRATTIRGYKICVKRLLAYFKDEKAVNVSLMDVQDFIAEETTKYSPKTIKNDISVLNASYIKAIRQGVLSSNPCQFAVLPKQQSKEIKILNEDNLNNFLDGAEQLAPPLKLAVHLALFCGLRRSEILGLTVADVNLNFKTISINKSRHRVGNKDIVQDTKTETSYRIISFPEFMLEEFKDCIMEEMDQSDYIITNIFGEPLNPSCLESKLAPILKKYNITLHGLRHTHASVLHDLGFSLADVSKQLGHANPAITLSIYTHIFGDNKSSKIANSLEKMSPKSHQTKQKPADFNG